MEQKLEQRFSDIQELLKYIKAHLTVEEQTARGDELDNIAKITLDMVETLKDIKQNMGVEEKAALDEFIAKFDTTTNTLKADLENLLAELNDATEYHTNLITVINETYNKYADDLFNLHTTLKERYESNELLYTSITASLVELSTQIASTNSKILTREQLIEIVSQLNESLDTMQESDRSFEKACKHTLDTIDGQLTTANKTLRTLTTTINEIGESFTESNSRVSVVGIKVDAVLEALTKEDDHE